MEALDLYRSKVTKLPVCTEAEFQRLLQQYRLGDEESGRAITGGYLGIVLAMVESRTTLPPRLTTLDIVQEANAALVDALSTFSGASAAEFEPYLRTTVESWLNTLDTQET